MSSVFELGGKAVNKNTAMAISGGTNYEPNYGESKIAALFKIKPLMPEKPKTAEKVINEQEKQYIGKRRSRLVVVGWFGAGGKWLCRCDCGYYTVRKISFLRNSDVFDACPECVFVLEKKRHNHWLRTGKDAHRDTFA